MGDYYKLLKCSKCFSPVCVDEFFVETACPLCLSRQLCKAIGSHMTWTPCFPLPLYFFVYLGSLYPWHIYRFSFKRERIIYLCTLCILYAKICATAGLEELA